MSGKTILTQTQGNDKGNRSIPLFKSDTSIEGKQKRVSNLNRGNHVNHKRKTVEQQILWTATKTNADYNIQRIELFDNTQRSEGSTAPNEIYCILEISYTYLTSYRCLGQIHVMKIYKHVCPFNNELPLLVKPIVKVNILCTI